MFKILIVEDSPLICKVLTKVFESDPDLTVVGVAGTGREGVTLALSLKPDIITMDIVMPDMDGVEATKQIMAYQPTPILILTSSYPQKVDRIFKAISFGALDVADKMSFEGGVIEEKAKADLINKIKFLSKIKVIRHPLARLEKDASAARGLQEITKQDTSLKKIIAIAASTGGPQAIASILTRFPKSFPTAILIVQHIAKGFEQGLADWLAASCEIKVKLAQANEEIKTGTAYIAPNDFQMKLRTKSIIGLSDEAPCGNFRPSADILFKSVAEFYRREAIGVILTGMGRDGAVGIKAIKDAGGKTIAQDEKTSVIFGMPKEAIALGAADKILPINKIADEIVDSL